MRSFQAVALAASLLAIAGCDERPRGDRPAAPKEAAAAEGMCVEHGVPEALCTKCNPALGQVFKAKGDWCGEHGFPESYCPICNPDVEFPDVSSDDDGELDDDAIEGRVVRFRSTELEKEVGIQTAAARPSDAVSVVECSARIEFNQERVADIRAIVPGIVRATKAPLGSAVAEGDPLFVLESTRVSEIQGGLQTAKERVRAAEANLRRQRELRKSDIASARQVELAERDLATAKSQAKAAEATLRMAGAARSAPSGRYTLRSPLAGTVVRRPAVVGLLATEETSLATIADTSVMWAICDVRESDAARVQKNQKIAVEVGGPSGAKLEGNVTWIAAEVDPRTRTVAVRAEIPNPDGRLRANQFARGFIQASAVGGAVSVPRAAIQRIEGREVVFVRTSAGTYAPRVVRRHGDGAQVEVEGRLAAGELVVTTGAVLLRTEAMPGSIGAGCCEVDASGAK
jgi:cobalt-zinc-cadmium efflux system membrane fusion protein